MTGLPAGSTRPSRPALAARAVVLDLDGTLVDSFEAIRASLNHARAGLGLGPLPLDEVKRLVGHGLEHLLRGAFDAARLDAARAAYRAHHERTCVAATRLLPGVRHTLDRLHALGIGLAVATNKPSAFTRRLLEAFGILDRFAIALGAEDVAHLKPHPEMLGRALAALGAAPDQAVYVGDMRVDAETARAAGVRAVLVASGAEPRELLERARPDLVLDRIEDLGDSIRPL